MKVPAPRPRVDVEAIRASIATGVPVAHIAAAQGFTISAVHRALKRAGIKLSKKQSRVRDSLDRTLEGTWMSIRARCLLPSSKQYPLYGARGIKLCAEWSKFEGFRDWARANGYEKGKALLLRVRSRGYRPSNCVWASKSDVIRAGLEHAIGSPGAGSHRQNFIDWRDVERLYVHQGLGVSETAAKLKVSYHGILRVVKERGWYRGRAKPSHEYKHGRALHKVWSNMREKCSLPSNSSFARVGGRGIRVDSAWDDFADFHAWSVSSGYRKGLVLTRLDTAANFGPENCSWLSRSECLEHRGTLTISRKPRWTITAFGETKGPVAWTRDARCTVTLSALILRLKRGMPPEDAITAPNKLEGIEHPGREIEAFGTTKCLAAWGRDRRARVGVSSIANRMKRGWTAEEAIRAPPLTAWGDPRQPGTRSRRVSNKK